MKQVEIPNDYFLKMSQKDYGQFETALIREFFQNSYDAHATQVVFDYDTDSGELIVFDDGIGMDYDTITTKLLVMGMSQKDSPTAVGAFGHAKILLYFSWEQWEIRTHNYIVSGCSHYYTITETDDFVDGTISTIKVNNTLQQFSYHFRQFFTKCDTKCKVFLKYGTDDMVEVLQSYQIGDKIYSDDSFDIYKSEHTGYYVIIRQNGVFMFQEFISGTMKKQAIVEINQKPELLFLQNRDYFNSAISDKFNKIKQEFVSDSIESFTVNHDTTETTFKQYEIQSVDETSNQLVTTNKIVTHQMDTDDGIKEINRHRSKRLLHIAYAYSQLIQNDYTFGRNIIFGFTNDNNLRGLWKYNSDSSEHEIYINLKEITAHSPNYRKMSIILLNVIKHEMSHAYNYEANSNIRHDEEFVKTLERMNDEYWDTTPFTTKFKEIWKKTSRG